MAPSRLAREVSQDRLYSTLLVLGTLIISALLLAWHVTNSQAQFERSQTALMRQSTEGAARTIALEIEAKRRSVEFVAEQEGELIDRLARSPGDELAHTRLSATLNRYLPGYFAFTIGDAEGNVLLDDFEGAVGEICQQDLREFAAGAHLQEVFIHPNPAGYHFDLMSTWRHGGREGIFFVSFRPDVIARVLANTELHGHQLLVLNRQRNGMIEIAAGGARDQLQRPHFLSPDELRRIEYRVPIEGTAWELVDLPDPALFAEHLRDLRTQAVHVFLILLAFAGLMLWLIRREEGLRSAAERELVDSHAQLERRVRQRTEELSEVNKQLRSEVDERRRAEHRLSESESRYALASRSSNEGIWDLHFGTDETYFSPRFRSLTGIEADEEAQLEQWLERLAPEDRARLQTILDDCRAGRFEQFELPLQVLADGGESARLLCRGATERGPDGEVTRVAGSLAPESEGR